MRQTNRFFTFLSLKKMDICSVMFLKLEYRRLCLGSLKSFKMNYHKHRVVIQGYKGGIGGDDSLDGVASVKTIF